MDRNRPPHLVLADDDVRASQSLAQAASRPQYIGAFRVPAGYEVWANGVWAQGPKAMTPQQIEETREQDPDYDPEQPDETPHPMQRLSARRMVEFDLHPVTNQPLWITRVGTVIDKEQEQLIEVAYQDALAEAPEDRFGHRAWITRGQLTDHRELGRLGAQGIPVNSMTSRKVMEYMERALLANSRMLRQQAVTLASRSGAYAVGPYWGWLVGRQWIGPPGTCVEYDSRARDGGAALTRGFAPRGDPARWLNAFERVAQISTVARWLLYSTFAAPLLRLCRRRTFVVHHWGLSGRGKSAIALFCQSAWGNPVALSTTFNATRISTTEAFAHVDDLPVLFDELQLSEDIEARSFIYAVCAERGRRRAKREGGLQRAVEHWRSLVRATGEEPMIGHSGLRDLGGASNRILQLNAPAMSTSQAAEIHAWLEAGTSWGHAGPAFLHHLVTCICAPDGGPRTVYSTYQDFHDELSARLGSTHERVGHLAVIAVAQRAAAVWLLGHSPAAARAQAIMDAQQVADLIAWDDDQQDVVEQARQVLRDHRDSNRELYLDIRACSGPAAAGASQLAAGTYRRLAGVLAPEGLWLLQGPINEVLRQAGLPPKRVWSDLRRSGALIKASAGAFAVARKYGAFRNKVYIVRHDWLDDDSEPELAI